MTCSACNSVVHDECVIQSQNGNSECKPSFHVGATENDRIFHHWVQKHNAEGKCRKFQKVSVYHNN